MAELGAETTTKASVPLRLMVSFPIARETDDVNAECCFPAVLFGDINFLNAGRPSNHPLAGIVHDSVIVHGNHVTRPYL